MWRVIFHENIPRCYGVKVIFENLLWSPCGCVFFGSPYTRKKTLQLFKMSKIQALFEMVNATVTAVLISGVGGIAHYLYEVKNGNEFRIGVFMINVLLAGWLGYVVMGFVPNDSKLFGPILSITWFCTWPVLRMMQQKWPEILERIFTKKP